MESGLHSHYNMIHELIKRVYFQFERDRKAIPDQYNDPHIYFEIYVDELFRGTISCLILGLMVAIIGVIIEITTNNSHNMYRQTAPKTYAL